MTGSGWQAGTVVTLAALRERWGQEFTFSQEDGRYTATARSGKRGRLTADTPGELLRYIAGTGAAGERSST